MTWYFTNLKRFLDEQSEIAALVADVDWVKPIRWHIDSSQRLYLDADITVGDTVREVRLTYPNHFPHHPPLVLPRTDRSLWSEHQWSTGELCLEYGPDNWLPEYTGAMMLRSSYKLLSGEIPVGGVRGTVDSRHASTIGQELRARTVRLVVTRDLQSFFDAAQVGDVYEATHVFFNHDSTTIRMIVSASLGSKEHWRDPDITPALVQWGSEGKSLVRRLAADAAFPEVGDLDTFKTALGTDIPHDVLAILVLKGDETRAYRINPEANTVFKISVIPAEEETRRLDDDHDGLLKNKVAIIGCGSVGSKIAVTLARAGIRRFVLVDDDIFLPDNIVRNQLDWRQVGVHKADAVSDFIRLVAPQAVVTTRKMKLGGQEASESISTLLKTFEDCDLLIDATADPAVFNLLSAVPSIPLVWAEVFGGGFGGLIARYRPGVEPPPPYIRNAIENWFEEKAAQKPKPIRDYGAERDGKPLISDDADVSVIAAHASRFAIELLIGRDPSNFPWSVYAIGLAEGSVFTQPFQTFPIDLSNVKIEQTDIPMNPEEKKAALESISEIAAAYINEITAASKNSSSS